ncbi:MAG TPA: RHS repeat domain-containing protein [Tepidisphaeraceae bacterium]|nr:RHS repeat domain-containing protein [Tepidisphaeraceae bacterium]
MSAHGKGLYSYTWDAASRQTQVITPTGQVTSMGYDAANRLIIRQYSNGAITTQSYDPAGNVLQITNNSPTTLVSRLSYTYNNANQRIVQAESDGTVTTWRGRHYENPRRARGCFTQ